MGLVKRGELNAQARRLRLGGLRGRHGNDFEAVAHPLGKQFDKGLRGRAGAKPKPHPRAHEIDRAGGGGAFIVIDVHDAVCSRVPAAILVHH